MMSRRIWCFSDSAYLVPSYSTQTVVTFHDSLMSQTVLSDHLDVDDVFEDLDDPFFDAMLRAQEAPFTDAGRLGVERRRGSVDIFGKLDKREVLAQALGWRREEANG